MSYSLRANHVLLTFIRYHICKCLYCFYCLNRNYLEIHIPIRLSNVRFDFCLHYNVHHKHFLTDVNKKKTNENNTEIFGGNTRFDNKIYSVEIIRQYSYLFNSNYALSTRELRSLLNNLYNNFC